MSTLFSELDSGSQRPPSQQACHPAPNSPVSPLTWSFLPSCPTAPSPCPPTPLHPQPPASASSTWQSLSPLHRENNFIKDFPQLADGLLVIPLPVEEQCRGVLSEPLPDLQLLTGKTHRYWIPALCAPPAFPRPHTGLQDQLLSTFRMDPAKPLC